jgi:4'-phosphopantetheinyl transferase
MNLHWLEQCADDIPKENDWLNGREVHFLDGLRFAKRRADWRLGRWTAKQALAAYLNSPSLPAALAKIEVRPASSGAPEAFFENKPAPVTISLSHRNDRAICVVAPSAIDLGCDLEQVEPRSDAFLADYFTAEEQALVTRHTLAEQPLLTALLWSGKESALKALRTGLRMDTRSVIVGPVDLSLDLGGWSPLHVHHSGNKTFNGWWQIADGMVRTVVAAPPPMSLVHIQVATDFFGGTANSSGAGASANGNWEAHDLALSFLW